MQNTQKVFSASDLNSAGASEPTLSAAIVALLTQCPELVAPILQSRLELIPTGTAGVRHGVMQLNIEWFKNLPKKQRSTLLCHEAAHLWLRHPQRMGEFIEANKGRYSESEILEYANIAMDCLINQMLLQSGFERIPNWVTYNTTFPDIKVGTGAHARLTSHSWETLTIILIEKARKEAADNPSQPQPGQGQPGQGQPGQGQPGQGQPGQGTGAGKTPSQDWGRVTPLTGEALAEAMQTPSPEHTKTGNKNIDGLFDKEFPPKNNAEVIRREHLRLFLTGRQDYFLTWSKLPRRPYPFQVQGKQRIGVGEVIVAIDVSSSMQMEFVEQLFAETNYIAEEYLPERMVVIPFNERVLTPIELGCGEMLSRCPAPNGGTNFEAAFEAISDYDDGKSPILFLTDMDDCLPPEPAFADRLIWVGIGNRSGARAPYGEYISMDEG